MHRGTILPISIACHLPSRPTWHLQVPLESCAREKGKIKEYYCVDDIWILHVWCTIVQV